jgi:hypothetical protein
MIRALYIAGSAHGFERGRLAVCLTLLSKPDPHDHTQLPFTQRDWYEA